MSRLIRKQCLNAQNIWDKSEPPLWLSNLLATKESKGCISYDAHDAYYKVCQKRNSFACIIGSSGTCHGNIGTTIFSYSSITPGDSLGNEYRVGLSVWHTISLLRMMARNTLFDREKASTLSLATAVLLCDVRKTAPLTPTAAPAPQRYELLVSLICMVKSLAVCMG
jgi:hypothetical protein